MSTYIVTLKDNTKTDNILPRTKLQAVADANGNYLDSGLTTSDINQLKGKTVITTDNVSQYVPTPSAISNTTINNLFV